MANFLLPKIFLISIISFLVITCKSSPTNTKTEKNEPVVSYDSFLQELKLEKSKIDSGDYTASRHLLFKTINNDIPDYWSGTPWDFNGTTQKPNNGHIACGYFLTTTMQQSGYDIKRVWMAQQASSVLIKEYCTNIKITSKLTSVIDYLKTQPDSSCYIIGLDFHTGFVTKNGSDYYVIHSNYINDEGVIKEKIETSEVLRYNKYFMIGSLSERADQLAIWMGW